MVTWPGALQRNRPAGRSSIGTSAERSRCPKQERTGVLRPTSGAGAGRGTSATSRVRQDRRRRRTTPGPRDATADATSRPCRGPRGPARPPRPCAHRDADRRAGLLCGNSPPPAVIPPVGVGEVRGPRRVGLPGAQASHQATLEEVLLCVVPGRAQRQRAACADLVVEDAVQGVER